MNPREALMYLQAILDDTLDHEDPTDAKRIAAVELAVATLKRQDENPRQRHKRRDPSSRHQR